MQPSILGIIFKALEEISEALKKEVRKNIVFTDTMATTLNLLILLTCLYIGVDYFKAYGWLIILVLFLLLLLDLFLHNQEKFIQLYLKLKKLIER